MRLVRRQRDPGLLEYAGKRSFFKPQFFPIPPNSDKKLEITYSQVLKAESGTVAYRYPLGTGNRAWANNQPVPMMRDVDYSGNKRPKNLAPSRANRDWTLRKLFAIFISPSHNIDISEPANQSDHDL